MIKNETRESAHLKSKVKDLSVVPNTIKYSGLFAAITPISKVTPNEESGLFDPVLIRDTDSLINTFGDPRIDPEKYIDLYSIMQTVGNGATCYVAKVPTGTTGTYELGYVKNVETEAEVTKTVKVASNELKFVGYSSLTDSLTIKSTFSQAKPYSIKAYYLTVSLLLNYDAADPTTATTLATARIKLENTTTNKDLMNSLNSSLGTYIHFELSDPDHSNAAGVNDDRDNSIVWTLLEEKAPRDKTTGIRADVKTAVELDDAAEIVAPKFEVTIQNYTDTLAQYKEKKYIGCLMADLVAPVSHTAKTKGYDPETPDPEKIKVSFGVPTPEERRTLHYHLKQIACERKDATVILSVPFRDNDNGNEDDVTRYDGTTILTMDEVCDWVSSQGKYVDLWNYGETNTTDYSIQSFYLEMYYSWLRQQCTWIENGTAKSKLVEVAPANLVINNILTSYRERGIYFPVAGDQYGTLPDTVTVLKNPKTKLERDQLVQYRINPIWDTGTRGVQIFGNETLNAGYTDLNAAHIARTLVYIRSTIDEYTETLKFSINSLILWDSWKNYVTNFILEPLKSVNALAEYRVAMGTDTTSAEEIANRTINGEIELRFYQSCEIFNLTYVVYSSGTTIAEASGRE